MSKKIETVEELIASSAVLNGASAGTALTFFNTMENVNTAIGPFIPFVTTVITLTKEIVKSYENAQYNKTTCGVLATRIEAAEAAVKGLMREKEENVDNFRRRDYYKSFEKFVNSLKKVKNFCDDLSQLSKFKKFITSGNIREKFQEVIKELDSCSSDLNLAITITTNEQMNKYLEFLHSDMIEMMKFLENVEGGITNNTNTNANEIQIQNQEIVIKINNIEEQNNKIIKQNNKILEYKNKHKSLDFTPLNTEIETIYILNEEVNDQKSKVEVKAKRIDPSELKDTPQYVAPRMGSRVTIIQKKIYKEMDVACKISMDYNIQKIQKNLAILEKLNICPYIIQFHGLSEIADENVMVFEWAEHGTLRELYLNFNIRWEAKIFIARDICRGLAFLHGVNIFHHDLKCDNILITENMQPKISNFNLSREFNAATLPIDNFHDLIHWLAPEKLRCIPIKQRSKNQTHQNQEDVNRYTIQCEIFSFGMLLWELGFQKKPYEGMNLMEVLEHVLNGGRETLNIGPCSNSIQKEYCAIIKLAWKQEPSSRPGIQHLFNMLQDSYESHVLNKGFPLLHPMSQVCEEPENIVTLDICKYYPTPSVTPLTPFDEGLQADKECNYEKAWKCFEQHANVGDMLATYWLGYYYSKGKYVEKDPIKAKELFKEAADAGISNAQVHYAFCLIDEETESDNVIKYLTMSADKNNATALYNLGIIYFFGQLGIEKDQRRGIQYLKQAALKMEPKSVKFLKDHNINYEFTNLQ